MPEFLQNCDTIVFYWINHGWSNPVFDKLMPFITKVDNWILVYLLGFYVLFFKTGRNGKIAGIALILTIIITDQLSSTVIKELVERIRPCHTLGDVNLLVKCGAGKSFPSSHAANNFAAATVITFFFKRNYTFYFLIAFLVALSRVYVGVHYPIDITAGAALGMILAYLISLVVLKISEKITKRDIQGN